MEYFDAWMEETESRQKSAATRFELEVQQNRANMLTIEKEAPAFLEQFLATLNMQIPQLPRIGLKGTISHRVVGDDWTCDIEIISEGYVRHNSYATVSFNGKRNKDSILCHSRFWSNAFWLKFQIDDGKLYVMRDADFTLLDAKAAASLIIKLTADVILERQ